MLLTLDLIKQYRRTDISDEATDYYKNDFDEINDLENQEESKLDIDKPFEDVSEFEKINSRKQKYLIYLSFISCITYSKMIKDYQVH